MVIRISTHTTLLWRFLQFKPNFSSSLAALHRHRHHLSSHSDAGHLIEVVDPQSEAETEAPGLMILEELIHKVTVLKSTPDWLPFRPGSSFWVPPPINCRNPSDLTHFLLNMGNDTPNPLSANDSLSFNTFTGGDFRYLSNLGVEEADKDIELMLAEVEAEIEEAEAAEAEALAEALAEAEAEAEALAEADAEALEAKAAVEAETQVTTNSGKTSLFENE